MYSEIKFQKRNKKFVKIFVKELSGTHCSSCDSFVDYNTQMWKNGFIMLCNSCYKKPEERKLKYNNIKTEYGGGKYDSKKEAEYAQQLDWRVKAGEIISWKAHEKIRLKSYNEFVCKYYVDFTILHKDKSIEYVEIKSLPTKTAVWRIKWRLLEIMCKKTNIKLTVVT